MVFCNTIDATLNHCIDMCHNPYFNRWFSAIDEADRKGEDIRSHNPYFNRWFSAITN